MPTHEEADLVIVEVSCFPSRFRVLGRPKMSILEGYKCILLKNRE